MESDINEKALLEEFEKLHTNDVEFTNKCCEIAKAIKNGTYSLLSLLEHLKTLLINQLPGSREKGMVVLAHVLEQLPNDLLSSEQLNVICAFYADRLNDHHQVIPAVLKGILILSKCKNVPDGSTKQILNSLFQNVPCQQQQQSDRLVIYNILTSCLDNKCTEMLQLSFDFVYGVISAMDGERDPRNLLYLFNWLPKFLRIFPLGHLTEEMFEVMACYFPVDFRAPSQDPDNISRDSLAESLCKCLCAVPEFGEHCLPLALEKLASTLRIAKLDSLNLIVAGCDTFELHSYIQHSTEIWSQIQQEVLQSSDEELENLALNTLEGVLNKLSKTTPEIYKQTLSDITDLLKRNLLPTEKLFVQSTKIVYHTAKSSSVAASFVVTEILPVLINTCNITNTPAHQVLLFSSIIGLVKIYIETCGNYNIMEVKELSSIPSLCIKAILQEDKEVQAVGLTSLAVLSKSLPLDVRYHVYDYLCKCLIIPQPPLVRAAVLQCLRSIAQLNSNEVEQMVLQKIQINNKVQLELYLDSLIAVVDLQDFTDRVLTIISDHCTKDIETVQIATGILKKLLKTYQNNSDIYNFLIVKTEFVFQSLTWLKNYVNILDTSKHKNLLENVSEILKILIGSQNSKTQTTTINSAVDSIILLYENGKNPALIYFMDGLLTRLRIDVKINRDVTDLLLERCIISEDESTKQVSLQLLANLLNKVTNEEHLQKELTKISSSCASLLTEENIQVQLNVFHLISWVTKALLIRGHNETSVWTSKLLELLDSYAEVAKCFKTIMCDTYDSLNEISYCNKRLLYQQKFFMEVSSKLSEKYDGENRNYLLAMGYLLQETPKPIFILQFNKIVRLIIMCLEHCLDEQVLYALLEALNELIKSKELIMEERLQEFLPRFIKLATFKNCMKVRIEALHCIQNYSKGFPVYKLLLHKQQVLVGLAECLDDKKRLVRKEAVDARNCWFIIDAPI